MHLILFSFFMKIKKCKNILSWIKLQLLRLWVLDFLNKCLREYLIICIQYGEYIELKNQHGFLDINYLLLDILKCSLFYESEPQTIWSYKSLKFFAKILLSYVYFYLR